MYPQSELDDLAARKAAVRRRVAERRRRSVAAATAAARPLAWVDTAWGFARRHSGWAPAAALSVGMLWRRGRGGSRLRTVLHWAPAVLRALRGV